MGCPILNTTADGALLYQCARPRQVGRRPVYREAFEKSSFDQMWTPVKLNSGMTSPTDSDGASRK